MKFTEILEALDVIMQSGSVPCVIGHAGIGKTQLANAYVKMYGDEMVLVSLFGSLLKEGELN